MHRRKQTKCLSLLDSKYKSGSTPNFRNPTLSVNRWKRRGKLHQVSQICFEMSFSLLDQGFWFDESALFCFVKVPAWARQEAIWSGRGHRGRLSGEGWRGGPFFITEGTTSAKPPVFADSMWSFAVTQLVLLLLKSVLLKLRDRKQLLFSLGLVELLPSQLKMLGSLPESHSWEEPFPSLAVWHMWPATG